MLGKESLTSSLVQLAHQGYVNRDESFEGQPNAVKVVSAAMVRARLGVVTPILWFPIDFTVGKDESKILGFETRIRDGVDGLIRDIAASDDDLMVFDDEEFVATVSHTRMRAFSVYILWLDPAKFSIIRKCGESWRYVIPV